MHGLRHGHKTWMAEDGISEILAEQRLGHQVPGIRGLYAHASDRMRDDLKHALQTRWNISLHATPGDREKMISEIPPNRPKRPARPTLGIRENWS